MTLKRFQFKHFRTRILFFVLSLLLLVQIAIFAAVDLANTRNAIRQINQTLSLTEGVFIDALASRKKRLLEKIRLLSSDYAFKKTFASGDKGTILSVLENHRSRVEADVMMLLDFDSGDILADTSRPENFNEAFDYPELLEQAFEDERGESSGIKLFQSQPYQFVVVPLFTPEPSAWIVIGFALADQFAMQLREATQTHVSIIGKSSNHSAKVYASTLPDTERQALLKQSFEMIDASHIYTETNTIDLNGEPYVSLLVSVVDEGQSEFSGLLQRPLNEALEAYQSVRQTFVLVFILAVLISITGVAAIARSVTRPVSALVNSAKQIESGDYTHAVQVTQQDELGRLAHSFNQMMKGLAERRQVRSLLGKVVSPEIAEELLKKDIELGGEEKQVSVLFSDVRNFTSLCEGRAPGEILELLNKYLTEVSDVIERRKGVIDKYIGDAVMALFGAPIQRDDDATRAVLAAIEMGSALDEINESLAKSNKPLLAVGVGINTDIVVAGNMGSKARLNYTVIGDGVNLASRLEGLTKQYGVHIIVSQSTKTTCPSIAFRELDKVRVKGKSEPVTIFEPLGMNENISEDLQQELREYTLALEAYRSKNWSEAVELFENLVKQKPDTKLYALYAERSGAFLQSPPESDWDGTFTFTSK